MDWTDCGRGKHRCRSRHVHRGEQPGRTHTHSRTTYGNTYASDGSDSTPVDVVVATWDLTTVEPE